MKIRPGEFFGGIAEMLRKDDEKLTLKEKLDRQSHMRKRNPIVRILREAKAVLELTHRSEQYATLVVISGALVILSTMLAGLMGNWFIMPVLAVGGAMAPFWYIILASHNVKKNLNAELETALSVITNSYIRSNDIIRAVEENIAYLNPPVVQVFEVFLGDAKLLRSDTKGALRNIKGRLANNIYDEWIDGLIACQDDRSLRSILMPIVNKLSDVRTVTAELDGLIREPVKEFIMLAIMLVGNVPLIYVLNKDWYHQLMYSLPGKVVLTIAAISIVVSAAAVIRLSRPIEYRR
jgi:Flp pilus assembly protein TadB